MFLRLKYVFKSFRVWIHSIIVAISKGYNGKDGLNVDKSYQHLWPNKNISIVCSAPLKANYSSEKYVCLHIFVLNIKMCMDCFKTEIRHHKYFFF